MIQPPMPKEPTPRSTIMFGPPGIRYVYWFDGMYRHLNSVSEEKGSAALVFHLWLKAKRSTVSWIQQTMQRSRDPKIHPGNALITPDFLSIQED